MLTEDSKLMNKYLRDGANAGILRLDRNFTIPSVGAEGFIEYTGGGYNYGHAIGEVVTNLQYKPDRGDAAIGTFYLGLEAKNESKVDEQSWFREETDEDGYFFLVNPKTKLVLTISCSDTGNLWNPVLECKFDQLLSYDTFVTLEPPKYSWFIFFIKIFGLIFF